MSPGRRKILIVDDNAIDLDGFAEVLGARFDLRRAGSGEEALAALAAFPAELVLLDIAMPGMDGFEACRRISGHPSARSAKVILVSDHGAACDRLRGQEVGASDVLVKPLEADELAAKVELFMALKSAEDEAREKNEFIAHVGHEIRNPMTAILGYSENLRDGSLSEIDRQDAIDAIWRNGQHLLELINNVLDLSKFDANRLLVERVECEPAEIIAEVVDMMRSRAGSNRVELTAATDGEIPLRIRTDPTRLKQILLNLVGNAIKFTECGSVRVVARTRLDPRREPALEIDVVDTGIGIDASAVAMLCQPFVQADATVTRRFGGSGLGLSISKRLATMLGGDLTIRSEAGRGSTFTVSVATGPLDGVPTTCRASIDRPRKLAATNGELAALRIPCRILLADDGPDNRRLFTFVLQRAGAEVTAVPDGKTAVDFALAAATGDRPFDVILMDMQMPVTDGYSATAMLRQRGYVGPIVGVTANARPEDRERCLRIGCDRFVPKPVDRTTLILIVHELLRRPLP